MMSSGVFGISLLCTIDRLVFLRLTLLLVWDSVFGSFLQDQLFVLLITNTYPQLSSFR